MLLHASGSSASAARSSRAAARRGAVKVFAVAAPQSVKPVINVIANNGRDDGRAFNGIPPVMGAHLMPSGAAAPLSVSKGPGLDVTPHPFQYPTAEGDAGLLLHFSRQGVAQGVVKAVAEAAEAAIAAKGAFTLVLSGGSLLSMLGGLAEKKGIAWDKVHVFFVDERVVPHASADSNLKGARDALLSKVPIPASQVHAIQEGLPAAQAATQYEGQLLSIPAAALPRTAAGFPVFDLVLLGVGPDGHVASLFPNKAATAATSGWVLPVTNSPKPPAERITMTLPVINAAKDVVIVAVGDEKVGMPGFYVMSRAAGRLHVRGAVCACVPQLGRGLEWSRFLRQRFPCSRGGVQQRARGCGSMGSKWDPHGARMCMAYMRRSSKPDSPHRYSSMTVWPYPCSPSFNPAPPTLRAQAEIVQRVLEVQSLPGALPAQLVRPAGGRLRWFVDVQAAQQLNIENWDDSKAFPRSS